MSAMWPIPDHTLRRVEDSCIGLAEPYHSLPLEVESENDLERFRYATAFSGGAATLATTSAGPKWRSTKSLMVNPTTQSAIASEIRLGRRNGSDRTKWKIRFGPPGKIPRTI